MALLGVNTTVLGLRNERTGPERRCEHAGLTRRSSAVGMLW
jgi:hypothetical protein